MCSSMGRSVPETHQYVAETLSNQPTNSVSVVQRSKPGTCYQTNNEKMMELDEPYAKEAYQHHHKTAGKEEDSKSQK